MTSDGAWSSCSEVLLKATLERGELEVAFLRTPAESKFSASSVTNKQTSRGINLSRTPAAGQRYMLCLSIFKKNNNHDTSLPTRSVPWLINTGKSKPAKKVTASSLFQGCPLLDFRYLELDHSLDSVVLLLLPEVVSLHSPSP
jgi:hypothetical protein